MSDDVAASAIVTVMLGRATYLNRGEGNRIDGDHQVPR
jgi:hypothetical protein